MVMSRQVFAKTSLEVFESNQVRLGGGECLENFIPLWVKMIVS